MNGTTAEARPEKTAQPREDLAFQPSPDNSVGVEIELQVLDRDSGDLAPGSVRILHACKEEGLTNVTAELMQSMIEIKTGICHSVAEVRDELVPVLRSVHNITRSLGYELAAGGTHPFHKSTSAAIFPSERYQEIEDRMAGLTYHGTTFGLHVHVGVPDGDLAIGAINRLVQYLPHLLALSANSPFWQGTDTGLASSRAALFLLAPHTGIPHHFANWKDFSSYCQVMYECSCVNGTKDIHWDIRPRPQTGTIEFRICDVPPTLTELLGLVALMHTLTVATQRLLEAQPELQRGDLRPFWVAVENKWLATRYGLKAQCVRMPGEARQTLAADVAELLDRLHPIAEETGDAPFLEVLQPLDSFESGADRQRRLFRENGEWRTVIDDMKDRWAQDWAETAQCAN